MAGDPACDSETMKARACEIIALDRFLPDRRQAIAERLENFCQTVLREIDAGKITAANWPEVEAELTQFVAHINREPLLPSPQVLECLVFADRLASRQGTHIPNWNSFYAEQAESDRRIQKRGDTR
jgi:hypothetical protein